MNITLINDLIDQHGDNFLTCKGCRLCDQIASLRTERTALEKYKHILDKGPDMTKSEIALMLENDVTMKVIRKALKMPNNKFNEMIQNFGLRKRGVDDVCMAVEEYYQLKDDDLKDSEIAKKIGVTESKLRNWKHKHGIKASVAPKPVANTNTSQTDKDTKSAEYESLIAELKEQLSGKNKDIEERNEQIEKLKKYIEEKEHLNAACEDIESELASVKEERDNYLSQLLETRDKLVRLDYAAENQKKIIEDTGKTLERYERENRALRALVRAWA